MGGSAAPTPPPPDDTLRVAQLQLQANQGIQALKNQNNLLLDASKMPIESWTPDIWSPNGAMAQAGQVAAINAFKSKQLEQQMNPHTAALREALPKMLEEDLTGNGLQNQMNQWARQMGLAKYLGNGLKDSTIGKSAFFDAATQEGQALRHGNEQAASAYLNNNTAPNAGLDAGGIISAGQGAEANAMQQRAGVRNQMLGNAQANAQSSTDWINQMMGSISQADQAHSQDWKDYQQAMMTAATENAKSDNQLMGSVLGAVGTIGAGMATGGTSLALPMAGKLIGFAK